MSDFTYRAFEELLYIGLNSVGTIIASEFGVLPIELLNLGVSMYSSLELIIENKTVVHLTGVVESVEVLDQQKMYEDGIIEGQNLARLTLYDPNDYYEILYFGFSNGFEKLIGQEITYIEKTDGMSLKQEIYKEESISYSCGWPLDILVREYSPVERFFASGN
jgi:hypothetical protein